MTPCFYISNSTFAGGGVRTIKKRVQDMGTAAQNDNGCVKGDMCHDKLIATINIDWLKHNRVCF